MLEGNLRPDARVIARRARTSSRTIFAHFSELANLYRHALSDEHVVTTLAGRMPSEPQAVLRAVLLGEFPGRTNLSRRERRSKAKGPAESS